ncbi:hypothetical protein [Halovibrio sp. HP20-50]|uniref:hypothetical protein n=1 Tax=Halovibrio sp. HP20-59 TaxID=3080275 RepID=UPI00294ABC05|nr:hypothetical protein [Halovibrio sp. HP20-59]MEA2120464.1 hypothetical protein [Halovibrio sp. HP20-59]
MRLTPWILPFALSAVLLTTTGQVFADNHASEGEQHEPLNDEALEETYGIKAGSVKRQDEANNSGEEDMTSESESSDDEERSPDAGTGGTGSTQNAINSSEAENSQDSSDDT